MITWNTDVNAPCCPGEILDSESKQSVLVQTDFDFPGVASSFGWNMKEVQRCVSCQSGDVEYAIGQTNVVCNDCYEYTAPCDHDGTDGTVDCPQCGVSASAFIQAAQAWLDENNGATADDPGYF